MVNITNRKSAITLYSTDSSIESHPTRIVLFEKGITADIQYIDPSNPPEDLLEVSPNYSTPTMVDRDLVLFKTHIIMEYLDERFPHPPLHPMDPVSRARARMIVHRVDQDWYSLVKEIEASSDKKSVKAKKMLREHLISSTSLFAANPYFMSSEFSLVDCFVAPLLWRLPSLGIDLPKQAEEIKSYASRIFERDSFQASLSEMEAELVDPPKLMSA